MAADEGTRNDETLAFTPQLTDDGGPFVVFGWGDRTAGFTTDAAREAAYALLEACAQADTDAAMWRYLMDSDEADPEKAGRIIAGFRSHRARALQPVAKFEAGL